MPYLVRLGRITSIIKEQTLFFIVCKLTQVGSGNGILGILGGLGGGNVLKESSGRSS